MNPYQKERIDKLDYRSRDVFHSAYVKINVEFEDFKVTEICPCAEEVTIETNDESAILTNFPMSALSENLIEEILDEFEGVIEKEEDEIEDVFDNNYWANI